MRLPAAKKKRGNPEADAQREIVKVLRAALPIGAIVHCSANEIRGGGHRARIQQGINAGMGVHPGFSDLIVLSEGRVLFLEVKSKNGRQSNGQVLFQKLVEKQGHGYAVVRSVDDAMAALGWHGFKTRLKWPHRAAVSHSGVKDARQAPSAAPARKNGGLGA